MCLFCFLNKFCWWFLGGSDITTGAFCMERQQINWGLNQNKSWGPFFKFCFLAENVLYGLGIMGKIQTNFLEIF